MTVHEKFEQQLMQSVEGIDLTEEEQRFLYWIAGYDKWTVDNLCSVIKKCRRETQEIEAKDS